MIDKVMPPDIRIHRHPGGTGSMFALSLLGVFPDDDGTRVKHIADFIVTKNRESAEQQAEQLARDQFPGATQHHAVVTLVMIDWVPVHA